MKSREVREIAVKTASHVPSAGPVEIEEEVQIEFADCSMYVFFRPGPMLLPSMPPGITTYMPF